MRILVVNMPGELWSGSRGGAVTRVIHNVAHQWLAQGHEVQVVTQCDEEDPLTGIPVVPLDFALRNKSFVRRVRGRLSLYEARLRKRSMAGSRQYVSAVRRAMRSSNRPDVVIFHNSFESAARLRCSLKGVARVLWLHNAVGLDAWTAWGRQRQASEWDEIICVSDYIRNHVLKVAPSAAARANVVLNGVDSAAFAPADDWSARTYQPAALQAITVGRLEYNKGADILVDAVKRLHREGVPVELTVVGDQWWYGNDPRSRGSYVNDLLNGLDQVGARWTGHIPHSQVAGHLRAANVFVDASRVPNPCPLSLLEAMATGCAVVSVDFGGNPQLLKGTGLLLDHSSSSIVEQLAERLRSLAVDRPSVEGWGRRARARSLELGWDKTALEARTVLAGAVERHQKGRRG